jgi:hypothetical protein
MSLTLDQLPALLKQLEDRGAEQEAFKALFTELQTTFADLLEQQEKNAPLLAKAIADALRGLRIDAPAAPAVNVAAPQVTVEVQPAPVHVQVTEKDGKGCDIEFVYGAGGYITGAKVRRV